MTLTKDEIKDLQNDLEALKKKMTEIVLNVSQDVTHPGDGKAPQHSAETGTDEFQANMNIELSEIELNILWQIDKALEKIENGTYGICEVSQKPIPLKRLKALPYASMTIEAQMELEKENLK